MSDKKESNKFLTYKGKPLVRCGNVIYYGDVNDRFIIEINIKSAHDVKELKVSDKVSVKLIDTDVSISLNKKIIKMSEKSDLFSALDIGYIWLDRAISYQNS